MMRHTVCLVLATLILVAAPFSFGQQSSDTVSVKNLMTVQEFEQAGLKKLTAAELEALDAWFRKTALRLLDASTGTPSRANTRALDFSDLEGAIIVAEDGEFLGKITTNSVDSQSIGNEVGRFGSSVSSTSIFNEVGRYGGEVARMSPFNSVTSVPPRIFKGERFIAYLTVNTVKTPRIDPRALLGWIKANQ
jgi:hypothetical protein